jgi:hypothetical protein
VLKDSGAAVRGCLADNAQKNNDSVSQACLEGRSKPETIMAKGLGMVVLSPKSVNEVPKPGH